MFDKLLDKLLARDSVIVWTVTAQCPVFWPDWAFQYLTDNPYITVYPGDILELNITTGAVRKKED